MFEDPDHIEQLIEQLTVADLETQVKTIEALAKTGDTRAVEPLIAVLNNASIGARKSAAYALGKLGDNRAVVPLITALDFDEPIPMAAAAALGLMGDVRAVEPLIAALKTENSTTRHFVSYALARLGDRRAFEPLLTTEGKDHPAVLATALGLLGDPRGIAPLRRIVAQYGGIGTMGTAAVWALGMLGEVDVLPDLLKLRERATTDWYDGWTFKEIDEAISHIKDKQTQADQT